MNKLFICGLLTLTTLHAAAQDVMSEKYRELWNDSVQTSIDKNIEKYRKADAEIILKNVIAGTTVEIEQISHDFIFGSNIFLYKHFDTAEKNKRYEDTFGELFNSATLPFYWKTLEPEKGKPRYTADSPFEFRRPATDPIVDFCEAKGLHMKGHTIIYGQRRWGHPTWMTNDRKEMEKEFKAHIKELAKRYKDRIHNWDVVNECYDQANRGIMPDDYTYKTYKWAEKYFPENVTFNTNELLLYWGESDMRCYVEIARDLKERGAKIDYMGVQMHIYRPSLSLDIAEGRPNKLTPKHFWNNLEILKEAELPIFISEVTITAPDDTEKGRAIQKELTRNYYRLWFSHPNVAGITWWNVADGGGAPGEPSYSGIFDENMNKKPAYDALDNLINKEWTTRLTTKVGKDNKISFRGFKGKYKITYKNNKGKTVILNYNLK